MRCKKCGKKLRAKEMFCTVCGYYNGEEETNTDFFENKSTSLEEKVFNQEEDQDISLDESFDQEEDQDISLVESFDQKEDQDISLDESSNQEEVQDIVVEDTEEGFNLKADASGTKEDEFYYKDEKFLEAYIGEDYKLIKKSPFNIYAFLLNWMYFLYRKMYLVGIIGLIATFTLIKLNPKNLIIYLLVAILILGLIFNKLYIFVSKLKVEYLLKKHEGTDNFTMESICAKKGGVNVRNALIIYFIFLVIIFFSIFSFSFNKDYNKKFWDQNSENRATCISLVKTAYKDLDNNPVTGTITEAVCAIDKSSQQEYNIYLKLQNNTQAIYVYYKTEKGYLIFSNNTENVDKLETKNANQTITEVEKKLLEAKKEIPDAYLKAVKKSQEEDKLIKEKKNTSEKINYIFAKEEIIR